MHISDHTFQVHDVTGFPVVHSFVDSSGSAYAARWEADMDALLECEQAFVIIMTSHQTDEPHEERKRRGLWLKANRAALGKLCRAVISVEPDRTRRLALQAQMLLASKAFGIPMRVESTTAEAEITARRLLA